MPSSSTVIAASTILFALCACGRTENSAATAATPTPLRGTATADGERFDLAEFSIAIPSGWVAFDVRNLDLDADIAARVPADQAARFEQVLRQVTEQGLVKLIAFERAGMGDDFSENLNVIVERTPNGATFDDLVKGNIAELETLGARSVRRETRRVGDNSFTCISADLPSMRVRLRSFLLPAGSMIHTITLTDQISSDGSFFGRAEPIVATYRAK